MNAYELLEQSPVMPVIVIKDLNTAVDLARALVEGGVRSLEITLRSVLRAGVAELLTRTDIPAGVTIAEFIDVARAFYSGPESGMANAVLDRIARALGRSSGVRARAGK